MILIKNEKVFNIEGAIRGMRNPLESWHRSDTIEDKVGENDLGLMRKLFNAGNDHRKFTRQIMVSFDITAPLYW